jgi:hypothetical protein
MMKEKNVLLIDTAHDFRASLSTFDIVVVLIKPAHPDRGLMVVKTRMLRSLIKVAGWRALRKKPMWPKLSQVPGIVCTLTCSAALLITPTTSSVGHIIGGLRWAKHH